MTKEKIRISLQENGVHSFLRAIEVFGEYQKTLDNMLLKDSIVFLHHGIELLMKQLLVNQNEMLIFEDIKDLHKKQKQADKQKVGIFFLEQPPKTVSYDMAIERVDAFVKPEELTEELRKSLGRLNRLRNQIEHYAIEADRDDVEKILVAIHNPLLNLFEARLGSIKNQQTPRIKKIISAISESSEAHAKLEQEVALVMEQFDSQEIPGRLLNTDGNIKPPAFNKVYLEYKLAEVRGAVDIFAEGQEERWVVEIKGSLTLHHNPYDVLYVLNMRSRVANAKPWLVVFDEVSSHIKQSAEKRDILITDLAAWHELKSIIATS
jgi:hypothetical protein